MLMSDGEFHGQHVNRKAELHVERFGNFVLNHHLEPDVRHATFLQMA
jgi:hypothetical protein